MRCTVLLSLTHCSGLLKCSVCFRGEGLNPHLTYIWPRITLEIVKWRHSVQYQAWKLLIVYFVLFFNFWALALASASYPVWERILGVVSGPQLPSAFSPRLVSACTRSRPEVLSKGYTEFLKQRRITPQTIKYWSVQSKTISTQMNSHLLSMHVI